MELLAQAKKNALAYYANFMVAGLLTFFVTPWLVRYLGTAQFGIWKACQKLMDVAGVADGRSMQALKWVIATHESDDAEVKQRAVGSALRVWLCFLPLLLVLLTALVIVAPMAVKSGVFAEGNMVRLAVAILGLNVILAPMLGIPDAVLIGTNNGYRSVGVQTFWLIASNAVMLVVAYLGHGVVELALVALVATIANAVCVFIVARKKIGWFGVKQPRRDETAAFFRFSGWVLVWALVERLLLSSEVLLLGWLSGPRVVTEYSVTSYVAQFAVAACLLTGSAVTPGLGKLIGARDERSVVSVVRSLREVVLAMATLFAGAMLLLNKSFVSVWMGGQFYLGNSENVLISLLFLQLVLIRGEAQIHDLGLRIRGRSLAGLIGSVAGGLFAAVAYSHYQSVLAVLVALLVARFLILFVARYQADTDVVGGAQKMALSYVGSGLILALSAAAATLVNVDGWASLCALGVLVVALLALACVFLVMTSSTRKLLLSRVPQRWRAA